MLACGLTSNAQVTVGTGGTNNGNGPWSSCWGYSYHQMIYPQASINSAGNITSLTFTTAATIPTTASGAATPQAANTDFRIYIGHTTKTSFSSTTDWEPLANLTLVYDGTLTMPTTSGQQYTINLTTPFAYNNTDNLIIAFDENSTGYSCTYEWKANSGQTNMNLYSRSDTTNPNPASPPSGTRTATVPQVTLGGLTPSVAPDCISAPTAPTDGATNAIPTALTWPSASGSPIGYKVYLGTDAAATNLVNGQSVTGNSYTITSTLSPNTLYYWKIVPFNGIGDAVGPCNIWTFTTATAPSCATNLMPADLATNVARNTSLSWTAPTAPNASSYDVYFGTSNNPPFVVNQTATTYVPGTLLANTMYYWKIVPKNAMGDATGCVVQSFTTGTSFAYCDPIYTSGKTDGDLISKVEITEGVSSLLVNDTGTSPTNPAYTYFTTPTATLQAGNTYNVTITVGSFGSQNVAVWIDYNDNGTFETNEKVGNTTATIDSNGSATFPITLACNPPLGTHRMRVRDVYSFTPNGSTIDPCATYGWGETEDYDVTVAAAVACPAPSAGLAENVTSSGATLKWNIGCSETQWDVHVAPAGSGAPTGAPSHLNAGPNTGFIISSGLTPATAYEFYVRANCGTGGFSTWAGPYNFTTHDLPPANDNCSGAEVLTVNADLNCVNVTTTTTSGATASTETAPTCVATGTDDDVWFKFTATSAQHRVSLANVANGADMGMAVYSGVCGSLVQFACSDPNTLNLTGLTVGTEYHVRVWTAATTYTPTAFEICVGTPPPPPANDACSTATAIPAIAAGSPYNDAQDATSATNNSGFVGGCTTTNDGVWYSIVGDGTTYTVAVTDTFDSRVSVYTGSCGSFTCVATADNNSGGVETVTFGAVSGVTYYINVGHYSGTTDSPEGPYSISVSTDGVLGTNELALENTKVSVYPNPFSDILNISDVREVASVSITDMAGRLVKSITKPTAQLQLGDLKSGLYLVTLKYKDGSVKTVKTVKK